MEGKTWLSDQTDQRKGKCHCLINRPMDGKKWWYTSITCITFPRESRARYIWSSCIGTETREVVDDNTNHRGAGRVFHTMNPIDTWNKPCKNSRIVIHKKVGWFAKDPMWVWALNQKGKGCQGIGWQKHRNNLMLKYKEIVISRSGGGCNYPHGLIGGMGLQRRWTRRISGIHRRVIVEIFRWIRRSSRMQSSPGGRRYVNLSQSY